MQTNYTQNTINIWFPNQKEPIYDPNDVILNNRFKEYWKREKQRCRNGFYLADGQVYISGHLYFHTVYWKIAMYREKNVGGKVKKVREIVTPYLRDIEWIVINEDFENCLKEGKFYNLVGSRDFGKSIIAASRAGWEYTFFNNSESVITGGADNYIKLATDKIEDGLTNLHPYFKKQRLSSDWKKEVRAGWKDKTTNQPHPKSSNSKIIVRNYENGTKSMAANGTRGAFHLIDEEGTIQYLIDCVKDSDGCWWSGEGDKPSCLTMLTGCVCAGTKVWTKEGKLVNVEDITKEDGIIGYDGKNAVAQTINWFKEPKLKPCYRIITDNNTVIECSDDHPLLITRRKFTKKVNGIDLKRLIYQEAKDININDQIIVPSEVNIFGTHSEPDARLIGLMIGDGNYTKGSTPTLSCSEKEIFEYVEHRVTTINKEYQISEDRFYGQLSIPSIKSKLIQSGIYGQVKFHKRLPTNIHTYNKQSVCELLAGYFDADGNIYYNKNKDIVRIVLTSVVYELLEEVKYQLLKVGIHSSIIKENRNQEPSEEYIGQQAYIYRLYINQQQDLEIFRDNIVLLVESKRNNLRCIKNSKYSRFNGIFEINPLNNKEGYFNRDTGSNIIENLRYETIKTLEYIGEKEVYNLNCSNNHNYISNSFITRQTGGDMEVGAEAAEIFFTPDGYNMLSFDNPETGGKMGRFIAALKAKMAYKELNTLSSYLGISHPDLDKITIMVSNEDKAYNEWWLPQYEKAKKSGNPKTVLKFKAYWPLKASDSFLTLTHNNYNVEAAKLHQGRLKEQGKLNPDGLNGTPVELYYDGQIIRHKGSNKRPVTEFPVKTQSTDCPIMIYEFPIPDAPWGLYIAGVDPYKQDQSSTDSLGSVYIYKRMHSISGEGFQDMFVASYTARPEKQEEWLEQARLLIKYYNAYTLSENEDMVFIRYMQNKGEDWMLVDQPEWLKDIVPNSTVNRGKGIHATPKIVNFLRASFKRYLDDVISKRDDGTEILGVSRIPDVMLLEEIIKMNKEGNYDRERAASICIGLADKMNPLGKADDSKNDPRYKALFSKKTTHDNTPIPPPKMFNSPAKTFANKRPKLFSL
jgi:LAGLIDADG-like domain/Intein splicing domain